MVLTSTTTTLDYEPEPCFDGGHSIKPSSTKLEARALQFAVCACSMDPSTRWLTAAGKTYGCVSHRQSAQIDRRLGVRPPPRSRRRVVRRGREQARDGGSSQCAHHRRRSWSFRLRSSRARPSVRAATDRRPRSWRGRSGSARRAAARASSAPARPARQCRETRSGRPTRGGRDRPHTPSSHLTRRRRPGRRPRIEAVAVTRPNSPGSVTVPSICRLANRRSGPPSARPSSDPRRGDETLTVRADAPRVGRTGPCGSATRTNQTYRVVGNEHVRLRPEAQRVARRPCRSPAPHPQAQQEPQQTPTASP